MSSQYNKKFDDTQIYEFMKIIHNLSPELYAKIINNNNECYTSNKVNLSNHKLEFNKINSNKNIRLDVLLKMNNVSDLNIYYKPILLIARIYNFVAENENICKLIINKTLTFSKIKSIIINLNLKTNIKYDNFITAIDILYDFLIDNNCNYEFYNYNLYIVYFLLVKTIWIKYIYKFHDLTTYICNGGCRIKSPINIINTIRHKSLLTKCILLLCYDNNKIYEINNIYQNTQAKFKCYLENNNHNKIACIDNICNIDYLKDISVISSIYNKITNNLIISVLIDIIKDFIPVKNKLNEVNYNMCSNCVYSYLLKYYKESIIINDIFSHHNINNAKIEGGNYYNSIKISNIKSCKKVKNLVRKKIKFNKNYYDCDINNIKTKYDLLHVMIKSNYNIQYYYNIIHVLTNNYKIKLDYYCALHCFYYGKNADIDFILDVIHTNYNQKICDNIIAKSELKYATSIYYSNYLNKFNLDFIYYDTILLEKLLH